MAKTLGFQLEHSKLDAQLEELLQNSQIKPIFIHDPFKE